MLKSSKILILFDLKIKNCYYKNAQEILGWSANGHHHWIALDLLMYSHQKLFTFICIHSQYKAELQKMHVSVLQHGWCHFKELALLFLKGILLKTKRRHLQYKLSTH